jgi:hypothetical protein
MSGPWKRFVAATSVAAALVLGGCEAPPEQFEEVTPETQADPGDIGEMFQRITAQQLDNAAQKGVNWAVADAVTWSQANSCMGCHRQPVPLFGGAISAYTGYQVNTSATNGTAYLAQFLANQQQPAGNWHHGGSYPFSSSGFGIFGMAGYTQYQSTAYLTSLHRGIDWAIGSTATYKFTNPMDGLALQGIQSVYVPADLDPAEPSHDIGNHFTAMTGQYAIATRVALDVNQGLTAARRQNYETFLRQLADSLVGQYVRSNGSWRTEAISYAALGAISDNRTPANNPSVAAMRDALLSRAATGGGWGQTAGATPNVYSTGMALYALCRMDVRADTNATVDSGLTWLANQQCSAANSYCGTNDATKDGSWNWPGHTNDVPTGFAVLAMGCYGSLNAQVTLSPISATLAPGLASTQTTSFNVKVKNTGYVRNTYELVPSGVYSNASGSMVVSHNNPSMTLDPGSEATDVVTVQLPANMPPSRVIDVSVLVSYDTRSGPATKSVTFKVYIPPQPDILTAAPTTTTILSPAAGAVIAQGSIVNLSARVTLNATGGVVTQGSLTLYTGGIAIATVQPDANGNFSYSWSVPYTTPLGLQTFTATYNGFATTNFSTNIAPSTASRTITIGNPNGTVCKSDADCHSGFCVDGVCCNSACGRIGPGEDNLADCQACSVFAGGNTNGTCGAAKSSTVCRGSRGICDQQETCDGTSLSCGANVVSRTNLSCGNNGAVCNDSGACTAPGRGLFASYYNNVNTPPTDPSSPASYTVVQNLGVDWGMGAPATGVNTDNFAARWLGEVVTPIDASNATRYDGVYKFIIQSDEGVRLWVDGKLLVDNWSAHTSQANEAFIYLKGNGRRYNVRIDYYELSGNATAMLYWVPANTNLLPVAVPGTNLNPAISNPLPVRIKSPADRTTYSSPPTVVVDVEAVGLYSPVTGVTLLVNDVPQTTITPAAGQTIFSWTLTSLPAGTHKLSARATGNGWDNVNRVLVPFTQWSTPAVIEVKPASGTGTGLTGDYFNGTAFNSIAFTRSDATVELVADGNPSNTLLRDITNLNSYSVRWTGKVNPIYSQQYTFSVQTNHQAKVWVNNTLLVDTLNTRFSGTIGLTAGTPADIKVEYSKGNASDSLMKLYWESPSEPRGFIPGARLYPNTASTR